MTILSLADVEIERQAARQSARNRAKLRRAVAVVLRELRDRRDDLVSTYLVAARMGTLDGEGAPIRDRYIALSTLIQSLDAEFSERDLP